MNMPTAKQETMELDIVSAKASIFNGAVTKVVVTGKVGELGIYPGHTALITALKPGQLIATFADGKEEVFYLSGGMLEVQPDTITVLSDSASRAEDLDEASVKEAQERAEKVVADKHGEIEYAKALTELAEAAAQMQAIKKLRDRSHR